MTLLKHDKCYAFEVEIEKLKERVKYLEKELKDTDNFLQLIYDLEKVSESVENIRRQVFSESVEKHYID